nr:hypothetical protein [uncultured Cohaesibacter sp.]
MLEKELPCEVVDIADWLNTSGYPVERIGFEAGSPIQHLFLWSDQRRF